MPYNTAAIPPRRDPTGQAQLPLSRVKKIIALDRDIALCSNNAAFVITLATEMFIQYMAEQGHNVVKSERKPRRNIQYRDLSSAVARHDNLEFLVDVVPRTIPYKEIKESKARKSGNSNTTNGEDSVDPGQTTLDNSKGPAVNGTNGYRRHDDSAEDMDDEGGQSGPNEQLETEIRGARMSETRNGEEEDVEMH